MIEHAKTDAGCPDRAATSRDGRAGAATGLASAPTSEKRPNNVLAYCRAGFESECGEELSDRLHVLGGEGQCRADADTGYVSLSVAGGADRAALQRLRFRDLAFARQLIFLIDPPLALPEGDRIAPLLEAIRRLGQAFSDCVLETPDTNQGRQLAGFLRKFTPLCLRALGDQRLVGKPGGGRLHLFFLDSRKVAVGFSVPGNASPWPMGIPRLRFPHAAPSRATLKLEEAFHVFLEDPDAALRPGMRAVDLGAAPGGWTYQLVRRHLRVCAVDNGRIAESLLDSGLVEHRRVDGFRYRPGKPVDWLVCDMVERPGRIAALVADWIAEGHCRHAIFNLKLPMKRRYSELQRCRTLIADRLAGSGVGAAGAFKQLYHDRAEVTGYLERIQP